MSNPRVVSFIKVCAVVTMAALLICVVLYVLRGMSEAREAAYRGACCGQLSQLTLAIRCYWEKHGALPPAFSQDQDGQRMQSWRVLILKCLGDEALAGYDLHEPWNDADNRGVLSSNRGDMYLCMEDRKEHNLGLTTYVAVVGDNTLWPGRKGRSPANGDEDKILLIELPHSDIKWTEPRDVTLKEALQLYREWKSERGRDGKRHLNYITLSGKFGDISSIPDEKTFLNMLTVKGKHEKQR